MKLRTHLNAIAIMVFGFSFCNHAFSQIRGEERIITQLKTETVAEIMKRSTGVVKNHTWPEKESPDRSRLPQNPLSPKTPGTEIKGVSNANRVAVVPSIAQTPGLSFNGVTGPTETGAFPPDDMGAIGPTQYIMFVNGRIRSFNKSTGVADGVLNTDPDVFFSSVMTSVPPPGFNFTSDPRIRYDRFSGKWILIIIDVPSSNPGVGDIPNRVLIAYSNSSTITAGTTFTFTSFQGGASKFLDYPTLGVDINALYIGGNMFSTPAGSFVGCDVFVINRTNLLSGGAYTAYAFPGVVPTGGSDGPFTPQGVDNPDPGVTEGYFIGVSNTSFGKLIIRRISNPAGVPTISTNIPITVSSTASPISVDHLGDANGTNGNLDALDDRLFAAVARNGRLWTAHNIAVSATGVSASSGQKRDGVRWYELGTLTSTPTLIESGTIFDPAATTAAAKQYFIPSVMVSGQGHAAFSLTTAGTPYHSNAETTGRLSGDVLGTLQTITPTTNSTTAYNPPNDPGSPRRWGDYSYVSLDPQDDMTMWMINQYCNGTNTYGCNITKLLAPLPATPASCSPSTVSGGLASVNVVVTGTAISGSGFYDPGTNLPPPALPFFHISTTVSGGITVNSITYTDPTHITLNLNTTAATPGTHTINVTNPDGQSTSGAGILTTTPVASGANWYVDDNSDAGDRYTNGSAAGNDVTGNGTADKPFRTINKAMSVASSGDNIYVDAGSYTEYIDVTKSLNFYGANKDISAVINTPRTYGESIVISPATSGIKDEGAGTFAAHTSGTTIEINGFKIQNGRPLTDAHYPRDVSNPQNIVIVFKENWIVNGSNLFCGSLTRWNNITINDNYFNSITRILTSSAIQLNDASGLPATLTATINDNKINTTSFAGILLDNVANATVLRNIIRAIPDAGIQVAGGMGTTLISQNDIQNANTSGQVDNGGIRLYNTTFTGPITISNNAVRQSKNGFAILSGDITGKNIHVNNNSFNNTNTLSIYNGATGMLDGECNFNGASSHPAIDGRFAGTVDFIPYLTVGTDAQPDDPANPATEGFQPAGACTGVIANKKDGGEDKTIAALPVAFKASVMPNPTTNSFTLRIESPVADAVKLRIVDASGKRVAFYQKITSNSSFTFGATLMKGFYYAQVIQGKNRQVLKLVKL